MRIYAWDYRGVPDNDALVARGCGEATAVGRVLGVTDVVRVFFNLFEDVDFKRRHEKENEKV
jgi:hypothetical protein